FAYGSPSLLILPQYQRQPVSIVSQTGVKQGDPLSTLLFCLTMHPALQQIASSANISLYNFVDDINIVGSPEEVLKGLNALDHCIPALNLTCNMEKSKFVYFQNELAPLTNTVIQALDQHQINLLQTSVPILGTIIGADAQKETDAINSNEKLTSSANVLFERVCSPNLAVQIAALMLRLGGIGKMNYLMRTTPTATLGPLLQQFDESMIAAAVKVFELTDTELQSLPPNTRSVVDTLQAPLRHGGFGFTSAVATAPIAYLSSLATVCANKPPPAFKPYTTGRPTIDLPANSRLISDIQHCIQLTEQQLNQSLRYTAKTFCKFFSTHPLQAVSMQHNLKVQASTESFNATKTLAAGDKNATAHLNTHTALHAWDWKTVVPTSSLLVLPNPHFRLAVRQNLGLAPFPCMLANCLTCHDLPNTLIRDDPWHWLSCNSIKRVSITHRHDDIVNNIARYTHYAGGLATVEVSHLSDKNKKRPDLQVIIPGGHYISDVKVVHATCPSHVAKYSGTQFGAARAGEKEKVDKYSDIAKTCHADFIPFVVETSGAFTKKSEQLINHIISTCAEHQQLWEPREVKRGFLGAIAIAVQRGNASAMFEGYSRAQRAIGNMTSAVSPSTG
ncbi:MAG TPA: reverse transcriptase domain-containing protein, partial [Ktedonobacteraceae bacterium]|nr:reverse transcriptase domain-containing protein [Ktedonobacteraceae bacterium]